MVSSTEVAGSDFSEWGYPHFGSIGSQNWGYPHFASGSVAKWPKIVSLICSVKDDAPTLLSTSKRKTGNKSVGCQIPHHMVQAKCFEVKNQPKILFFLTASLFVNVAFGTMSDSQHAMLPCFLAHQDPDCASVDHGNDQVETYQIFKTSVRLEGSWKWDTQKMLGSEDTTNSLKLGLKISRVVKGFVSVCIHFQSYNLYSYEKPQNVAIGDF